jgi:V/A-type H+-transporting ATPase subunit I
MFTPERMHQINVMVFETEVDAVAQAIVRLGIMHLVKLDDEDEQWIDQLGEVDTARLRARIDRLHGRVVDLMKDLGVRELPLEERDTGLLDHALSDLDEIEHAVVEIEQKVQAIVLHRKELEVHLERLQGILNEVSPLTEIGLPPGAAPYTFLEIRYGQVRTENLELIREKLAPMAAVVLQLAHRGDSDIVLVIGLKTDRLKLKRILRDASFEDIEMPAGEESREEIGLVTGELEERIDAIREQIAEADRKLAGLRAENAADVTDYSRSLRVAELLLKVKGFLRKTRKTYIFSGWVPSDRKHDVEREIFRAARGRAIVEIIPPEKITGVKGGRIKVPVMLKNPGFFRPFELLVSSYGLPDYAFVDPTFFVAISFLIMFGAMFGDVGHGAILAVIGWLLGFRRTKLSEGTVLVGRLAFYCGCSSVVFGFLYGSIFGVETLIPHLWMSPMGNVMRFFKFAVFFGVTMISIGIVLNIINAFRARNFRAIFFDHAGVVSAVLYWSGVGAAAIFLANRSIPVQLIVFGIAVPIVLLFLREPLSAVFGRRRMRFEMGVAAYVMESVVEVLEIVSGYLGNTVSFIRVGAFALAHAGLFIAVFSLESLVHYKSGGLVYSALILVLGNVIIIGLEGLVVTIQAVRLEYYEFFGKFFMGGGTAYKPIGLGGSPGRNL